MLLRTKDKDNILQIFKKVFNNSIDVWAYGSRVNGNAHDMSDLDLVLISKNNQKIFINDFVNFKNTLTESNIPILIQILDWNKIPEYFKKNISNSYVKLN